jgi:hypothetical protein
LILHEGGLSCYEFGGGRAVGVGAGVFNDRVDMWD